MLQFVILIFIVMYSNALFIDSLTPSSFVYSHFYLLLLIFSIKFFFFLKHLL